jgi:hypothetical protein
VTIHNDFFWYDTDGNLINVRSGALRKFGDLYYWYGGAQNDHNQTCYSSCRLDLAAVAESDIGPTAIVLDFP